MNCCRNTQCSTINTRTIKVRRPEHCLRSPLFIPHRSLGYSRLFEIKNNLSNGPVHHENPKSQSCGRGCATERRLQTAAAHQKAIPRNTNLANSLPLFSAISVFSCSNPNPLPVGPVGHLTTSHLDLTVFLARPLGFRPGRYYEHIAQFV